MKLLYCFQLFGINPVCAVRAIKSLPKFFRDKKIYLEKQREANDNDFIIETNYPCIGGDSQPCGKGRGAYFYQDLLIAQKVFQKNPVRHIDVGSRVDGFVAHVASFRKIEVIDIRALDSDIPNVSFVQGDFMSDLSAHLKNCCDSVSCLHALEHFGLGRYGDPVNPMGWKLGLDNLSAMVRSGGVLYLSVPIGTQRIEFNAHRVFSVQFLLDQIEGLFVVQEFDYVDDKGFLHTKADMNAENVRTNFGCHYGCGILTLVKK